MQGQAMQSRGLMQGRVVAFQDDGIGIKLGHGQGVVQVHRDHERLDLVITVWPAPQDLQE